MIAASGDAPRFEADNWAQLSALWDQPVQR